MTLFVSSINRSTPSVLGHLLCLSQHIPNKEGALHGQSKCKGPVQYPALQHEARAMLKHYSASTMGAPASSNSIR